MRGLLFCCLLIVLAEPSCDTRTSDERGPSEIKPGENPIPEVKVQYEQAPQPIDSGPTFEDRPYWTDKGCDGSTNPNGGRPWPQGGVQ